MFTQIKTINRILQTKVLKRIILFVLIFVLVIDFLACFYLIYNKNREINTELSTVANEKAYQINNLLRGYVEKSSYIISNEYILDNINKKFPGIDENYKFAQTAGYIINEFKAGTAGRANDIYIYTDNENLYESTYFHSLVRLAEAGKSTEILKKSQFESIWDIKKDASGEIKSIVLYRNFSNLKNKNVLEMDINFQEISNIIEYPHDNEYYIGYNTEKSPSAYESEVKLLNGARLVCGTERSTFVRSDMVIVLFDLLILIFVFVLIFISVNLIIKRSFVNIENFLDVISYNTNDFLEGHNEKYDESDNINVIQNKIVELLKKNKELNDNYIAIKNEKYICDLNLLQMKINPHLIYNTLSVIKWNVLKNNDTDSARIIDNMIKYYRHVLNFGNDITTVSREAEMTQEYLEVMSTVRYNKYKLVNNIPPEIENKNILKMLFQPIAENSVLHAFANKTEAVITLNGREYDDHFEIDLSDNGYGMTEETLDSVISEDGKTVHYGIKNVRERIRFYYGEGCDLKINSTVGVGTVVTFILKDIN